MISTPPLDAIIPIAARIEEADELRWTGAGGAWLREKTPFFSAIIPTYGDGDRLRIAVDSVLSQTFQDFEVIVIDDAGEPPAKLAPNPRLRLIRRATNGGAGAARNVGISVARGEWVTFLDADDHWQRERLAAFAQEILNGHAGFWDALTTDLVVHQPDGYEWLWSSRHPFEMEEQFLAQIRRPFLTVMFASRRESLIALGGFDENLVEGEDADLLVRLLLRGGIVRYIDRPLATYNLGVGKSSDKERLFGAQVTGLEKLLAFDLNVCERLAVQARRAKMVRSRDAARRARILKGLLEGVGKRKEALSLLRARELGIYNMPIVAAGVISPKLAQFVASVKRILRFGLRKKT